MWHVLTKIRQILSPSSNSAERSAHDESASELPVSYNPVSITLPLTDELLLLILAFVPAKDLLRNCIWVNEWQSLIDSQSLWLRKCENERKPLPKIRPDPLPDHFYRSVYFVPYGKNLLVNSSGESGLVNWVFPTNTEHYQYNNSVNCIVENEPQGMMEQIDPIPDTEILHCFATSYYWANKEQCVDLLTAVGGYSEVLDSLTPAIQVSEWVGTRFDCGSEYKLSVNLETDSGEVLDNYTIEHRETVQLGQWQRFQHVFRDYPPGVRVVRFTHSGKDTQFWAGYYGAKMAQALVTFVE